MDRRTFLGALSAAGLTAAGTPLRRTFAATAAGPSGQVNRVAVIGAGIVGASIAYNLWKRGCEVILIDKRGPAASDGDPRGNAMTYLILLALAIGYCLGRAHGYAILDRALTTGGPEPPEQE